ncbi:hypothetical protein DLAC_03359 [Tieghemostelium lacteum]|uniref:EGF-like domain-containing protein n=1 Tax=Tieghemostelium lacteum TaxID=361077 RepID=A0A152A2B3_TIELA|nr:hypothetical protein DLAC_03359 [Tieghemostelium lacteum]|eukprot:KYR00201.1 hypothetical protein DLAC_03359 [Tieghemostelium lacteum]
MYYKYIVIISLIAILQIISGQFIFKNLTPEGSNNIYGSNTAGCVYTVSFYAYNPDTANTFNIALVETPTRSVGSINITKPNSFYGILKFTATIGSTMDIVLEFRDNDATGGLLYKTPSGLFSFPACEVQPYPLYNIGETTFYTGGDSIFASLTLKFSVTKFLTFKALEMVPNDKFHSCTGAFTSMTTYSVICYMEVDQDTLIPLAPISPNVEFSLNDNDENSNTFSFPTFINTGPQPTQFESVFYPGDPVTEYRWPSNFYQSVTLNGTSLSTYSELASENKFLVNQSPIEPNPPNLFGSTSLINNLYFVYGNQNSKTLMDVSVTYAAGTLTFYVWSFNSLVLDTLFTPTSFVTQRPLVSRVIFPTTSNVLVNQVVLFNMETNTIGLPNGYEFTFTVNTNNYAQTYFYQYPFGLISQIPSSAFSYSFPFALSGYSAELKFDDVIGNLFTFTPPGANDTIAPVLRFVEYLDGADEFSKILRIRVRDYLSGVYKIDLTYFLTAIPLLTISSQDLVSGDIYDGIYEKYFIAPPTVPPYPMPIVNIIDNCGNKATVSTTTDYFPEFPFETKGANSLTGNSNLSIERFEFEHNNIDLSVNGSENVLRFSFLDLPTSPYVSMGILFDSNIYEYTRFYGTYEESKMYYSIKFRLPSRLLARNLDYFIQGTNFYLKNTDMLNVPNATLTVTSNWADRFPPMVTNVVTTATNGTGSINLSWKLTIEDEWNGFKDGMVSIVSDLDPFPRNFTITPISSNNIYLDTYNIQFDVSTADCVSQTFSIYYLTLTDTNGLTSDTDRQKFNPFLKISDTLDTTLAITCVSPVATTSPSLTSLNVVNTLPIDIGADDIPLEINFTTTDTTLEISQRHTPFCYLTAPMFNRLIIQSEFVSFTDATKRAANWKCTTQIPYGFGAIAINASGYPLSLSIHGWANTGLGIGGVSSEDLVSFTNEITTVFNIIPIITDAKLSPLDAGKLKLDIFGRQLAMGYSSLTIYYEDGSSEILGTEFTSNPYIKSLHVKANQGLANITLTYGVYITPPFQINTNLPTETPEPTVTPDPVAQCKGTPLCGGPSNGVCTATGCQCIDPWMGPSCQSQVIYIQNLTINTNNPTIDNNFTVTLPDGEEVSLQTLISVVQLNEYNIKGERSFNYIFDKWLFTNTTSPSQAANYQEFLYETDIDSKNAHISVYVQHFSTEQVVSFAGQNMKMKPSTLKYKIFIDNYTFTSQINYLELVMMASIEDTSNLNDVCSSTDFGPNNDQTTQSDYVKLQVGKTSLFGRFISRGIIDGTRITNITNRIIDMDNEELANVNYIAREYIGMRIPYFKTNATLDPDFSVLVDTLPVDKDDPNSMCDHKKSKGLSKSQIAGIIIGCILFVASAITVALYFRYKKRKQKIFIKNINVKLNDANY